MAKKTKDDPTGLRDRRKASSKKFAARLKEAHKKIRALIKDLPFTKGVEKNAQGKLVVVYDYSLDFDQTQSLYQSIRAILNEALLEIKNTAIIPLSWWWKNEIELPYRKGTAEELVEFNKLIDEAMRASVTLQGIPFQNIPVELVLTSPQYLSRLNKVYVDNYDTIKSLSDKTASQVIQQINSGMDAGLSRRDIGKNVASRFDVAGASSKRIVDTEINKSYNDAKLDATEELAERTGLRPGVVHISALSPTTRETHANRNNHVYTPKQQRRWWNSDANRINCKCTVRTVLLDKNGNVVSQDLQRQNRVS